MSATFFWLFALFVFIDERGCVRGRDTNVPGFGGYAGWDFYCREEARARPVL